MQSCHNKIICDTIAEQRHDESSLMPHTSPGYRLRPIQPLDREPLYEIHRAAMRDYVAATWGWNEAVQIGFWKRTAHDGVLVIERDGKTIGYVDIQRRNEHIDIVNIVLDPRNQGQGIGTAIIQQTVDDARAPGQDVHLQVLKVNPRAQALYARLGFEPDGESDTHVRMIRRATR